jgi:ubiquinone/menaquinone biosynthesis methyltransferase
MSSAGELLRDKLQVPFEFNRIARRYDLATSLSQGYRSDLDLSVRRMQLQGDEYLADLCCGTGKSTIACLHALPGGKVLGIDFSEEMLNQAVAHVLPAFPGRVEFRRQNIIDIDDPDRSFDAIFMAYGIRNMPDYRSVLTNLYRILRPGGVIAFHEYSIEDTPASRMYWYILGYGLILPVAGILTGSTRIFRYLIKSVLDFLSPSEFLTLLKETGFQDVKAVPLPGWRRPILKTFIARKT